MSEIWTNWARDQHCAPTIVERPASEEELARAIVRAVDHGQPVRAVGAGHSFTDIACTDGVLLDLSAMGRPLHADPSTGRITVQAGIRLHALGPWLAERGLALENQGDIDRQTLAGALATATHGTGLRFGNLSTQVIGMRLVTGSGEVVELTRESDPEALLAARVSVGSLGIASTVTLQCVPLYTLRRVDRPQPLDAILDALDAHVDGNDHFEFWVFPFTRTALTRTTTRIDTAPTPSPEWRRRLQEDLLENRALELVCRTGRRLPRATPRLNRLIAWAMSESTVEDRAYKVYASRRDVRFNEMEYAIPRAHGREAVERVLQLVERRRLPILFPLEVRFTAGDDAFLSTAYGRDTCYIAVHQYTGMEFESYFRGVEAIMDEYDGRPHWGKRHYQSAATLSGRYPDWDRFQVVRARLDPSGSFTNDYALRTLGSVGAAVPVPGR
ncbi:MAG TPA: D-arabinono-1,4-lactone oxidase [Solirubrobacteraceae bacterium]|jgi:L-gulonolactone oxidase|nr:D-arabinono-1,4-lactone oxidase [Solirubrobacteraceae bacterium]